MFNDRIYINSSSTRTKSYRPTTPIASRKVFKSPSSSNERLNTLFNRGKDGIFRPKSIFSLATEIDFDSSTRLSSLSHKSSPIVIPSNPRLVQLGSRRREPSVPRDFSHYETSSFSPARNRAQIMKSEFHSNFTDNLSLYNKVSPTSKPLSPPSYYSNRIASSYKPNYTSSSYRFTSHYYAPKVRDRPLLSNLDSKFGSRNHVTRTLSRNQSGSTSSTHSASSNETTKPALERNKFLIKFREYNNSKNLNKRRQSITWDIPEAASLNGSIVALEKVAPTPIVEKPTVDIDSDPFIYGNLKQVNIVKGNQIENDFENKVLHEEAECVRDKNNNLTRWGGSMALNVDSDDICYKSSSLNLLKESIENFSILNEVDVSKSQEQIPLIQLQSNDLSLLKVEKVKKKKKKSESVGVKKAKEINGVDLVDKDILPIAQNQHSDIQSVINKTNKSSQETKLLKLKDDAKSSDSQHLEVKASESKSSNQIEPEPVSPKKNILLKSVSTVETPKIETELIDLSIKPNEPTSPKRFIKKSPLKPSVLETESKPLNQLDSTKGDPKLGFPKEFSKSTNQLESQQLESKAESSKVKVIQKPSQIESPQEKVKSDLAKVIPNLSTQPESATTEPKPTLPKVKVISKSKSQMETLKKEPKPAIPKVDSTPQPLKSEESTTVEPKSTSPKIKMTTKSLSQLESTKKEPEPTSPKSDFVPKTSIQVESLTSDPKLTSPQMKKVSKTPIQLETSNKEPDQLSPKLKVSFKISNQLEQKEPEIKPTSPKIKLSPKSLSQLDQAKKQPESLKVDAIQKTSTQLEISKTDIKPTSPKVKMIPKSMSQLEPIKKEIEPTSQVDEVPKLTTKLESLKTDIKSTSPKVKTTDKSSTQLEPSKKEPESLKTDAIQQSLTQLVSLKTDVKPKSLKVKMTPKSLSQLEPTKNEPEQTLLRVDAVPNLSTQQEPPKADTKPKVKKVPKSLSQMEPSRKESGSITAKLKGKPKLTPITTSLVHDNLSIEVKTSQPKTPLRKSNIMKLLVKPISAKFERIHSLVYMSKSTDVTLAKKQCQVQQLTVPISKTPKSSQIVKKKKESSNVNGDKIKKSKKVKKALTKEVSLPNDTSNEPKQKVHTIARKIPKKIRFREYNIEDFLFLTVLGRGSFGKVLLAELRDHDCLFAVKCLKKHTVIEDDDVESIMIERKVLAFGSTNPFICKLFCTFQTESHLFFAMEWCSGGDLMFHVQKEGKFSEDKARFYTSEILCAMWFLHQRGIIYRDLKLDNIMIYNDGHIRLVDFGMCQGKMYREELLPSNFCGTPEYMAPEIIKGVKYNHSVDYWALGIVVYEMCVGTSPFQGTDEDELLWNVCHQEVHYPKFLSVEVKNLIFLLLKKNPMERLGMATCRAGSILSQHWLQSINWDLVEACQVNPPFIPELSHEADVSYFDQYFTKETPCITPGANPISEKNQLLFEGFNYTNHNMTE